MSGRLRPPFAHPFARIREIEARLHDLDGKSAVADGRRVRRSSASSGDSRQLPAVAQASPQMQEVADEH